MSQSALCFTVRVTLSPLDDTNGTFLINSVLVWSALISRLSPSGRGFALGCVAGRGAGRVLRALLLRTRTRFGTLSAQLRTSNWRVDSPHHAGRSDLLVGSSPPFVTALRGAGEREPGWPPAQLPAQGPGPLTLAFDGRGFATTLKALKTHDAAWPRFVELTWGHCSSASPPCVLMETLLQTHRPILSVLSAWFSECFQL